ncbi:MAG: GxxExxY protein [Planctomycetota bacterium]|jgi:GxxExxY protein
MSRDTGKLANVTRLGLPEKEYPEKDLTEKIIGCAIKVHRALGPGYLEAIYENALAIELTGNGLRVDRQRVVKVLYEGVEVGEHRIDLVVEGRVVLELKSVESLNQKHTAQIISTLRASGVRVGLLINFNEARLADGIRRVVL